MRKYLIHTQWSRHRLSSKIWDHRYFRVGGHSLAGVKIQRMAKLTGILGVGALFFAIIDMIHGPHNGDAHRTVIHTIEFIFFFGFLCLSEFWAIKAMPKRFNLNRWMVMTLLSFLTWWLSLFLWGISAAGSHGDGGPITLSFLLLWAIGWVALPVSFVGFVVDAILRKCNGVPVLTK